MPSRTVTGRSRSIDSEPAACGGKWATFYAPEARTAQLEFLDRYLRGHDIPAPPRVRLEVRESRDVIASVREEDSWPLERTEWRPLYVTAAGLATTPPRRLLGLNVCVHRLGGGPVCAGLAAVKGNGADWASGGALLRRRFHASDDH